MYRQIIGGAKCSLLWPTQPKFWVGGLPCSAQMGSIGSAVSSPSGVRDGASNAVAFCCIACSQNASGCNNVGSSVSIAMSGKMIMPIQAHVSHVESGICWQLTPYKHHSRSNRQINFYRVENCGPLNFAALFGRTPRTCLRPALSIRPTTSCLCCWAQVDCLGFFELTVF